MAETLSDLSRFDRWAFVCEASDCRYRGAPEVRDALARALDEGSCTNVAVVRTGCLSLCGAGPAVVSYPDGGIHLHVEAGDATELAVAFATGTLLPRRAVRAPRWYTDSIKERLGYFVQLLKSRQPRV